MAPYTYLIHEADQCFIPLKPKSKQPVDSSWPQSGRKLYEIDVTYNNVGLLLGEASGVLDVDLDCYEAKALAEVILPKPAVAFDRGSEDSGHYLYLGLSFGPRKVFSTGSNETLVELRGDGAQTMVPPSVHPNGQELKVTSTNTEALEIDYQGLLRAVNLLAASAEVAQHWHIGVRHDLALAFAGLCSKEGVRPNLIIHIVQRICELAHDLEVPDRLNAVKSTVSSRRNGLLGFKGLVEIVGKEAASRIAERVRFYCGVSQPNAIIENAKQAIGTTFVEPFTDRSELTEARIAKAFENWLSGKAVFVIETKDWMLWNGNHWELDQRHSIYLLAYEFIREIKASLFERGSHRDAAGLSIFESLRKLENITRLASINCAVSKVDFDVDPFLLAAGDTWIDLQTGLKIEPNPNQLISKWIETPYRSDAECPQFIRFLEQIFEGDAELIRFVQKAIGYSLTGSTAEQCLFIMVGDGANGKSTFINLINNLLGSYGTTAAAQTLIANGKGSSIGDDLVDLVGARLISVSETEEGQSLAEAKIKQMTGGDTLKGRPLYGTYVQFMIIGKLWLATNSLPQINNTDFGIWRRIMAIPFHRTFSADQQDKSLGQKLQAELPGILKWAVDGCLAWQEEGLNPPSIVQAQINEYRTQMDSIMQWVQDECTLGLGKTYQASKLYSLYRDWCGASGRKAQSASSFKRSLEKLDGVHQVRTSSGNHWNGIAPFMTTVLG